MNEGSATVFCGHNKGRLGLASAVSRGLSLRLSTNQPATGTTLQPPAHYQTLAITIVRITIVKSIVAFQKGVLGDKRIQTP
jgi:hypothetical protein